MTNGDVVSISGVEGTQAGLWNGIFGIYGVTLAGFKYYLKRPLPPSQPVPGTPMVTRLTFPFDEILRALPTYTRIHIGPGVFLTRGFALNDARGWQPKTGQKIVGAGTEVTTLRLVGAENPDQHYHIVGMPIETGGSTPIVPLEHFEISDVTLDCNVDSQPVRLDRYPTIDVSELSRVGTTATAMVATTNGLQNGDTVAIAGATDSGLWNGLFAIKNVQTDESFDYTMNDTPSDSPASGSITATKTIPYANVACGAVRVLGNRCRIHRVKAINWGTKSFKQGCFVISLIHASGRPMSGGESPHPIITETQDNGIEDCIVTEPSKNNVREATALHIGGLKNETNHAQGFGGGAYVRRNFVDCLFFTSVAAGQTPQPFGSAFVTSKTGTAVTGTTGKFVGKRAHSRNANDVQTFVRLNNPKNSLSRWNGYFPISAIDANPETLFVNLATSTGTTDDSSLVIMGTEFRGIAVSAGVLAVVGGIL